MRSQLSRSEGTRMRWKRDGLAVSGGMVVISLKTVEATSIERWIGCLPASKMKNNRVGARKTGIQIDGQSGRKEMVEIRNSRKAERKSFCLTIRPKCVRMDENWRNTKRAKTEQRHRFISYCPLILLPPVPFQFLPFQTLGWIFEAFLSSLAWLTILYQAPNYNKTLRLNTTQLSLSNISSF